MAKIKRVTGWMCEKCDTIYLDEDEAEMCCE
jgi:hypothetical protein